MATVRLNDAGKRKAGALIKGGDVVKSGAWAFSAEEGSAILGDPPNWDAYAQYHLGIRTGTSRKTKQAYAYPYGKGSKVWRPALVAVRQRAAQQGHSAVFNAAGALLQEIDGKEAKLAVVDNMDSIGAFATDLVPIEWSSLPEIVIQVLPYTGEETLKTVDGRELRVTDESIQSIADKFNGRENPLVVDYEHGTYNPMLEMGSLAAGWIHELWPVASDANIAELADERVREAADLYGPGVYAIVHLTEQAAGKIRAREYAFLSPVVVQNDELEVLELLGAGLTNDPAIDGMMPVAAKRKTGNVMSNAAGEAPTDPTSIKAQGDDMDLEKMAAIFGRKFESESELTEHLATMKAKADTADVQSSRVQELEAESVEREAGEAVTKAIAEGRLAESQKEWAIGLFQSDRTAWDGYLAATTEGAFSTEDKLKPPQERLTDDSKKENGIQFPNSVSFFGADIPVNKDQLAQLEEAVTLSREKFDGDLARAIAVVRR